MKTIKKTKKRDTAPPLLNPDSFLAITDNRKANLFGNHLYDIFQPYTDLSPFIIYVENVQTFLSSLLILCHYPLNQS